MAFDFHSDKDRYFKMQLDNAEQYVLPFIQRHEFLDASMRILEIGCAEGGVLKAFLKMGCKGVGIELMESRLELAKIYLEEFLRTGSVELLCKNIYDVDVEKEFKYKFDLIILKDVIEHIPDQDKFLRTLRKFLNYNGKIFLGFPPWYMPFGGHQQICKSKIMSRMPYVHLLPGFIYKIILKIFGESDSIIKEMMDVKYTGIGIERFEYLCNKNHYHIALREFYLINPIYKYKFNLTPKVQIKLISYIPFLRNFFTTCAYYLIEKKEA